MAPLLSGCAACSRRNGLPADRVDRRSLLRACAGGVILSVIPAAGCANDDTGAEAELGKDGGQAGNESGKPREASVGPGEAGQAREIDAAGQAGEVGPGDAVDATMRADEVDATARGGEAAAPNRDAEIGPVEAGCSSTCPTTGSNAMELTFDAYPALAEIGGTVLVQLMGYADPVCGSDVIMVLQPTAGKFLAFSAACTHQCCAFMYQASASRFYCGCHGSAFDLTGKVIAGPATRPLTALKVCSDACGVHVTG